MKYINIVYEIHTLCDKSHVSHVKIIYGPFERQYVTHNIRTMHTGINP